jgi:HEAT repeat protein
MPEKTQAVHAPAELERALLFLQGVSGDEAQQREHLQAVQYLLDHSAEAHPRLLALLQSGRAGNPHAVIEILPRFEQRESIPVIEALLAHGPESLRQAAAGALATHPLVEAKEALLRGLNLPKNEAVIATADALMARGDPTACPELKKRLAHPEGNVRYHVIQAAFALGCLEGETLRAIAQHDSSAEVRELAARLLKTAPNSKARGANP